MKLVLIPAGTFIMGTPKSEQIKARMNDEVQHEVTISKPFYMGITHVTVAQYAQFVKESGQTHNEPAFKQTGDHPVVNVNWNDTQAFCTWMSKKTGKTVGLPTEGQWEYACRAGTATLFSFGDNVTDLGDYAWHGGNSRGMTHPVAHKIPNAWGLYDMHGIVWQWCQDYYGPYAIADKTDPTGSKKAGQRVVRGGSWGSDYPANCRSAFRSPATRPPRTPSSASGWWWVWTDLLLAQLKERFPEKRRKYESTQTAGGGRKFRNLGIGFRSFTGTRGRVSAATCPTAGERCPARQAARRHANQLETSIGPRVGFRSSSQRRRSGNSFYDAATKQTYTAQRLENTPKDGLPPAWITPPVTADYPWTGPAISNNNGTAQSICSMLKDGHQFIENVKTGYSYAVLVQMLDDKAFPARIMDGTGPAVITIYQNLPRKMGMVGTTWRDANHGNIVPASKYKVNQWILVLCTVQQGLGVMYINGKEVARDTHVDLAKSWGNQTGQLSYNTTGNGAMMGNANFSSWWVWNNRVLTAQEASQLYANPWAMFGPVFLDSACRKPVD